MRQPPVANRLACWALFVSLVVGLAACTKPPVEIDPLAEPTPFSFQVDNPEEVEGPLYGVMFMPFEGGVPLGSEVVSLQEQINLDAFLNVIEDGELDADGLATGSFIPPRDIPRVNELLGIEFGWWVFFPPAGCDVTVTNPIGAALAPAFAIVVWDGETLVDDMPAVAALLDLETFESTDDGTIYTSTSSIYVAVVSQSAWSAATDGPCVEGDASWSRTIEFDLQIDAGWQFLHLVRTFVEDMGTWEWSEEYTAVSMTLEEIAAAGPIGTVEPIPMGPPPLSSAQRGGQALRLLFR